MNKLIILLILLLSSTAYAGYPLQTDSGNIKGKGNFEIELGVKGIQGYDKDLYYVINPEIGIDVGVTDWADAGVCLEFIATFPNGEDTIAELGLPSFFVQIKPFKKYDFGIRADYVPTWNDKQGHALGGVLIKTFTIGNYYLDLNAGGYANELGNGVHGNIFGAIALRSDIPKEDTQFEFELVYSGNPADDSNHTLSFILALVLTEPEDSNPVVIGIGANWDIIDVIEWYAAVGVRFGYEK